LKKAFLSLNFYRVFSQKQNYLKNAESAHKFSRLSKKAMVALKQYAEIKVNKRQKMLLIYQIYEHNCQKNSFYSLRQKCIEQKMLRMQNLQSTQFYEINIQSKCLRLW